jgi:hypothetical protein
MNGEESPKVYFFSQTPQFFEEIEFLQFGSTTGSCTYMKAVLYPPGVPIDVSAKTE